MMVAALLAGSLAACAPEPPPRNLVFLSLDTTRTDHLSAYGYERDTTPALAALAERSVVFKNGFAQMTITNPSHASMFSGLYPKTHEVGENTRELAGEFLTVTEILAAVGFRTGGFVSGHPLKSEITGIDQGFEHYDGELKQRRDGTATTDRALEWLAGLQPDDRFFLFVHLYDAHGPYRRRDEYEPLLRSAEPGPALEYIPRYQKVSDSKGNQLTRLNEYVDRYDRMLRYQDDLVARILDAVDLERTAVVIVADHGETLGDREKELNLNHGTSVYDEQTSIPFLFYSPAVGPGRLPHVVETVDLLPTVLDLMGLESPPGMGLEGESLFPLLDGSSNHLEQELAFASSRAKLMVYLPRGYELEKGSFIHSVRSRRWKLMLYPGVEQDYVELYNLEEDPEERVDVSDQYPEQRERLLEALEAWRTAEPTLGNDEDVSPEDVEDLRALGYVG